MTLFPESLPFDKQPYPVPENWAWVTLGQIIEINPPKPKPNISDEELCSFVPMSAVSEISGAIHAIEEQPFQKVKNGYTGFQEQDVLLAKITPCMENGKAAIAKNLKNGFGYGSTEFFVLRCSHSILNQYIYYVVRSRSFRDDAKPNMTGSVGQKRVPKHFLSNYHVPLPPLPEQRRIAAKLDTLLGKLREARTLIDEARESFALRRAAILHQAFSGKLTAQWRTEHPDMAASSGELFDEDITEKPYDIPETWKWVKLKEIGEIVTGTTPSKKREDFYGHDVPFFKPTDLNQGYFVEQTQDHLSYLGGQEARILPEKSIMVTCIGTIGKTGFSRREGATNQQINSILPSPHIIPEYVYFGVNSHVFQQRMIEHASATTIAILNKSRFGNLEFPLAPLEEQREIVRQLESLLGHETDAAGLLDMDDELDLLEQSILSRALRGELGTNDPAESPALA